MQALQHLRVSALAALLALTTNPAVADIGSPPPLRPPAEPTTLAHVAAAQSALQRTLETLRGLYENVSEPIALAGQNQRGSYLPASSANPSPRGSPSRAASTIRFGGYVARAREDLADALALTAEAAAFVRAHPEDNPLAAGPAQTDEPKPPLLPNPPAKLPPRLNGPFTYLTTALGTLDAALSTMVNNPAHDYHGPILGSIGGHRAKIIAAISRVGTDLGSAVSYYQNRLGGELGIIPLSASASPPPDPQFGPTARMYLAEVQSLLESELRSFSSPRFNGYSGEITQGGNVPKVAEALQRAKTDVTAALAYLDAHPAADVIKAGPAGPEPTAVRRATIPALPGYLTTLGVPKLNPDTVSSLNTILGWLQNNPAPDYHGPVLGDLSGYRAKIINDLGQAQAPMLAGIEFTARERPPSDAGNWPLVPTATAILELGLALTLAVVFGRRYFFSRRKV